MTRVADRRFLIFKVGARLAVGRFFGLALYMSMHEDRPAWCNRFTAAPAERPSAVAALKLRRKIYVAYCYHSSACSKIMDGLQLTLHYSHECIGMLLFSHVFPKFIP